MALFGKRKPAFQLNGLVASDDGLYDGSFVVACAKWWNHEVESRGEMRSAGYRAFSVDEIRQLCGVVQPGNRVVFEATASAVAPSGRLATATLSLAYAFALVTDAGATQPGEGSEPDPGLTQARPFTLDDLAELERHYSEEGWAREYQTWAPFWMAAPDAFVGDRIGPKLVRSLRAVFDDQVDRWMAAEGDETLRRSIGPVDFSLVTFNKEQGAGLVSCLDLLFEWGGRLRLGERFLAEGSDLTAERFGPLDDTGMIDHFYGQIWERFVALATQDDPVGDEISYAVGVCVEWLGHGKSENERQTIVSVAKRAYLWRQAHDRVAYQFMEPKLSQAIAQSRVVGESRSANEPFGLTLYYAASQCLAEGVNVRLGSVGGLISGPKAYERALYETTDDLAEQGFNLDDHTKRLAFQFGVSLADVEHMLVEANTSAITE